MAYPDEVLADSPYLYWRLGEAAGSSTVTDSSTNGRGGNVDDAAGTGFGATSLLVNQPGNTAFECAGSGGAVPYSTDGDFSALFSGGALTVEAWVRRSGTSLSSGRIANKETGFGLSWNGTSNQPRFGCFYNNTSGKNLNATTTLNQDEDYHIVGVAYEESGTMYMDLYINGVLDASTTQAITTFGSNNTSSAFAIGARISDASSPSPAVYSTNTFVDEVAIYPTALSAQRIEDHYNAGIASPAVAPTNSAVPTITTADAVLEVGSEMTSTDGTWAGTPAPTYAYQWEVSDDGSTGWTSISGATSSSYTLTSSEGGKYVRLAVTATNTAGTATAYSAASAFVAEDPVSVIAPTVSGTAKIEEVLTANAGTWTGFPSPDFSYQWERSADGSTGWANISGATAATYTLANDDKGKYVRVQVTGTNNAGSASAASEPQGPVQGGGSSTAAVVGALRIGGAF